MKSDCLGNHWYTYPPTHLPTYLPTYPHKLFFAIAQPPVVRFEHVRTLFDSTQSQESKSEVAVRNKTRQCALGPVLFSVWQHVYKRITGKDL